MELLPFPHRSNIIVLNASTGICRVTLRNLRRKRFYAVFFFSCKCSGDCTNGPSKFHVPKHVQSCFLEQKHESSGLIVTLIGEDYIYRGDFYHESKSEPHVEEQLVAAIYDLISKYKVCTLSVI